MARAGLFLRPPGNKDQKTAESGEDDAGGGALAEDGDEAELETKEWQDEGTDSEDEEENAEAPHIVVSLERAKRSERGRVGNFVLG